MTDINTNRTPGQIMRAAREARQCSLHEAEEGTKIPKRLIEAIERDEYHKLSGALYVKSFLRNYAGWLGLDTEEILSAYELATGRPEQTGMAADEVWSEDQVAVTRVGMPWGRMVAMAMAAVVVLVVLVVVALQVFGGGDEEPTGATAAVVPQEQTTDSPEPSLQDPAPPVDDPASASAQPEPEPARVVAETQPTERAETREERLARLTQGEIGGLPEDNQTPPPTEQAVATDAAPATPARQLSPPRRGDPELRFLGGEVFPLVLRVLMPEPANCTVRRDDQSDAVPVIWPDNPEPPPAYNLRHGLAYTVTGGYAIYWGAGDHFTLTLGRIRGAEVSLNGQVQSLGDWRPGQTKLLDAARLPRDGR